MKGAALLLLAALAACQTAPPTTPGASSDEARALYASLTGLVKSCWFGGGDTTFAGYNYSPEVNAGVPRILIVTKADPGGRPVLVVEPLGRAAANVYGPLLQATAGGRAKADLDRWIRGGTGCAA
jgi:hypothetical protein